MFSTVYKKILKPLLFLLQPETAHHFTFGMIKWAFNFPLVKPMLHSLFKLEDPRLQREVFGLKFSNPVGLAAGFDKDARLIDEMAMLGFGFIEILLLAGVGFFIFRWMKQRNATQFATSSPQGYGESYNNYSSPSAPLPQTEEEITSVLGQRDPNFQLAPFKEARTDDFFKLQAALMGRDLGTVRDKVTPEILSVLESDIATLKTAGKINRIENIAVRETEIVEAWEESDRQYATLRLKASLLDYTVDDKMGTLLSGSTTDPIKFDEHWTFVKEVNAPHWKLTAIENNI